MARRSSSTAPAAPSAVERFLSDLDHPHKEGIELLRRAILQADARIREEIKWNAPSFRLEDHFATFKLHPPRNIQIVLHTGAKPKSPAARFSLDAPAGLVKWAAPDRCVVTLESSAAARERKPEVVALVRQWIAQLEA